jgi:hypothetical protein
VNDLVDYVSLGAKTAGKCAALYSKKIRKLIPILHDGYFAYCVPQFIDMSANEKKVDIYFRSRKKEDKIQVTLSAGDEVIISKKYVQIRPSEMELLQIDIGEIEKINNWKNGVSIKMEKVE